MTRDRFAVLPDGKGGTSTHRIPRRLIPWCGCYKVTRADGSTYEELCDKHAPGEAP